ncbi:hypothetical protein MKW92_048109 [Papaver armeniacum]|nr:hypothetical protein MKW92_048109 [Papaver armeniacum]
MLPPALQVPEEEKRKLVGNVFSSVASSYDLMNDLMSAGLHRLWKDRLVSKLHPIPGMKYLDVAGGTVVEPRMFFDSINSVSRRTTRVTLEGDLDDETQINVCDINPNMLSVGKKRVASLGENRSLVWVEGDADALKFGDGMMDGYTIAFGIRNVTHIEKSCSDHHSFSVFLLSVMANIPGGTVATPPFQSNQSPTPSIIATRRTTKCSCCWRRF